MSTLAARSAVARGIHALIVTLASVSFGTAVFALVATAGLLGFISDEMVDGINLTLPWLILLGLIGAVWKGLSYRIALPLLAISGASLVYLAWDQAPSLPPLMAMPKMAPEDSPAVITYRRLLKGQPGTAPLPNPLPSIPAKREEWPDFVVKNRAVFEQAWETDMVGREWIESMAAHTPDGLYPVDDGKGGTALNFSVLRHTLQVRWARALLLLRDGKADEAAGLLIPLLRANYHLQRGGATLLNQMFPVVGLKGTYERLDLVADSGALSTAVKAEIAAALREAPPVPENIALAFFGEEIVARAYITQLRGDYAGAIKSVASTENSRFFTNRVLGRFLFNPNRTEHDYVAFLGRSCRLAQARQFAAGQQAYDEFESGLSRKRLKNPVGQLFVSMVTPAFSKTMEATWKVEDQRVALLERYTR